MIYLRIVWKLRERIAQNKMTSEQYNNETVKMY